MRSCTCHSREHLEELLCAATHGYKMARNGYSASLVNIYQRHKLEVLEETTTISVPRGKYFRR